MQERLEWKDQYMKDFDAEITSVGSGYVTLSRSAFYPGGGGQPCDTGRISCMDKEYEVTGVEKSEGEFRHMLKSSDGLAIGDRVMGRIDWERRYAHMRYHTAIHVLDGVVELRQKKNMIEEISVRGRKRGIGLLVATQRPANISKNVLAQCSYGFIGKLSIENDVQAIRILFSTQEQLDMLPRLQTGSFLPFGVEGAVETVLKVKRREAVHSGSTPLLSQAYGKKNIPIAELLKEIRGEGKNHEATPVQKQKAPSKRIIHLPSLARRISEADARSIAKKKSRKEFMLFGRETEEIESVSPGYIDAYMMRVLIPSRKRGEYEDSTILMGEGFAFRIDPRQQVECVRVKSAMLAENEARALEEAQKRGRTTTEYIAKKLRIDEINAGTLLKKLEKKGQVRPEGKYYVPIITHRFSIPEDLRNIEDASDAHSTYYHIKGGSRYMEKTVAALFPGSKVMWSKEAALPFYTIVMKGRNGKARVLSIDGIYGMNFHPEPK